MQPNLSFEEFPLEPELRAQVTHALHAGIASDFATLVNLALKKFLHNVGTKEEWTTRGPRLARGSWSQDILRGQYPDIVYSATDLAAEVWMPIPDCPGYLISNLGRVVSRVTGREKPMKHFIQNQGYRQVTIKRLGKQWQPVVHVLVARLFVPNPSAKPEVNHINGDHADCRASNLEWVNKEENTHHARESGIRAQGAKHPMAKLTEKDVTRIRKALRNNLSRAGEFAMEFGISRQQIVNIASGKSWRHVSMIDEKGSVE